MLKRREISMWRAHWVIMELGCVVPSFVFVLLKGFDMKLNFQKFLMAAATMSAVVLAGCSDGNGSSNTATVIDPAPITVSALDASAVASVQTIGGALVGQSAVFGADATANGVTIPQGSTLTFTTSLAPTTATISGFDLATPDGDGATGDLDAGSCIFKVKTAKKIPGKFLAGQTIKFDACTFAVKGNGQKLSLDSAVSAQFDIVVTFNGVTTTYKTTITVQPNGQLLIDGKVVGTVKFVSGATGING